MLIFTAVELQIRLNRDSQDYQPPLAPPFFKEGEFMSLRAMKLDYIREKSK